MKHLAGILCAAALLPAATLQAADLLAVAKSMADTGEDIKAVTDDAELGWYVVTVSKLAGEGGGNESDPAVYARLAGKRRIAGYVSGEKVEAKEASETTEATVNGSATATETYSQKIKVEVDALMRGIEPVGEVEANGDRYLVLVVSAKTVDATKALADQIAKLPPGTVRATGIAQIADGDAAAAQKAALASAKSSAVEMVLGTAVASGEAAINMKTSSRVISRAGGFIKDFRVEREETSADGKSYKVVIVAEVERERLMKDYGAILAQFGNVKFHVLDCGDEMLNTMLKEQFAAWKCPLTLERDDADYLVWHKWVFADETHPMDGRTGTRLTLTLGVRDAASGKEFWAVNNDPRKAVSFVGEQKRRIRNAADLAMKEIHEAIHERLDRMIGRMAATGREVRMVFDNYSPAYEEALGTIKAGLAKIPGCGEESLTINSAAKTAVLEFTCQTDMETFRTFMDDIMKHDISGAALRPDTTAVNANTWNLTW